MDSFLVYCSICCLLVLSTDGVTLTLEMKSILPLKGSSLELSCIISEQFDNNVIMVWKERSQVTICYAVSYLCDFYKTGYSFTSNRTGVFGSISNLTTEAEGTWRCSYRTTSAVDIAYSNSWSLIVYNVVNVTLKMNSSLPLKGSSLELSCNISDPFSSNLIVVWKGSSQVTMCFGDSYLCDFYKTGYSFTSNRTGVFGSISSLTTEAEGTWRCSYRTTTGVDIASSNSWSLIVYNQPSLPSVQAFQGNFPWLENQTGTLQCVMADYGNPKASVIWLSSRGTSDMNSNLVFRNLSSDDHGQPVYCQVQNNFTDIKGVTVVSSTITLNVEYRPIITLNPSVQELRIKEGSNLTVTCMASGNPLPIVQWKNMNPPSNTLLFPGILRNSTGAYTCVASSTSTNYNHVLLQREESVIVIVEFPPEKPFNFHASNIQEKQLSLRWQSRYNGGYTQTFVVEISLDNITWNNVSQVSAGNRDGWFSIVIEDLIPGSEYYLRLYAYNINGRGDFADVQLAIRTLKDCSASVGIGVGGAVGVGVGGIVLGLIGAIIAFTIRRQLNGSKCSCFRSKRRTDNALHTYSNTEMNPHTVKPIYEELNKRNTEQSVYDKVSPL